MVKQQASPRCQPVETLTDTIERVIIHSPKMGFCVLNAQARIWSDLVPVIDHAPVISVGEWISATGV